MNIDPQIGTSRSNSLQIPTTGVDETSEISPTLISAINDLTIDNNSDGDSDGERTLGDNDDTEELRNNNNNNNSNNNNSINNGYSGPYNNDGFGNSTTTISQPVAPAELLPIIVDQPTATMIIPFRLRKSREEMSQRELIDFVISPVPQCQKVLCKITRSKEGFGKLYPQYELYIEEQLETGEETKTFLLSARKRKNSKSSNYVITIDKLETGILSKSTVGKVRSNFLGTAFAIYSNGRNPFKNEPNLDKSPIREELGAVVYDPNILGFKGPRKMTVLLTGMTKSGQRPEFRPAKESQTLIGKFRNGDHRDILVLHNKSPQWNEDTQSYVLNFNGRVTLASVKNFQIVHDNDLDYIIMQFGRVEEDTFTMDFMYPMCPLQAFAIALTSFDAKLACE
ncbi:hypothetical protein Glove_508g78 [Diversispora epigaea]|uniref:Tubby C-terminal domain-containing protein n=1 Tax=Diversispora epigaea TaxID=1348612 RepID=A0A397GPS6_9GLOM|nr:hypothetical protein Glove_508g78 [Diversispora epigaea]